MSGSMKDGEKSIGEQVADLLLRKPQNYDVIFSVGPQKTKVDAVKILLKAASPVFERNFEESWDHAQQGEQREAGIPLPDFDPSVFKLFVHLIISDTWSAEALCDLNLPPNTVLKLLGLCRHYKITKAIENVEKAADDFIQNFWNYKDTSEFLQMSQRSLETVLSCEQLPLNEKELFECVCRWAKHQCHQKGIESTGENYREVLGSCLREIRFPILSFEDFTKISALKNNLFTAEEKVGIFEFIGTHEDHKARFDRSQLPFKTNLRSSFGYSVLRLTKKFEITQNPPFVCDGQTSYNHFQVNKKIALHGVGFLGPIGEDTLFDVNIQIRRVSSSQASDPIHLSSIVGVLFGFPKLPFPYITCESGTLKKNIFAPKENIFYFLFDDPITIEPSANGSTWDNYYVINYSLKGANNVSQFKVKVENPKQESVKISDVEFNLHDWNNDSPLAELLFKHDSTK